MLWTGMFAYQLGCCFSGSVPWIVWVGAHLDERHFPQKDLQTYLHVCERLIPRVSYTRKTMLYIPRQANAPVLCQESSSPELNDSELLFGTMDDRGSMSMTKRYTEEPLDIPTSWGGMSRVPHRDQHRGRRPPTPFCLIEKVELSLQETQMLELETHSRG